MDEKLDDLIMRVKEELKTEPDSIIYGELCEGATATTTDNKVLKLYFEFLGKSDGARCGAIDLWSINELDEHQYRVSDFIGGTEKWMEVGQVLYEPLVIDKHSGQVCFFKQGYSASAEKTFGDFNYFLFNYVFGPKYEELVPDVHLDDWYQFLKRINLA
ncbi:hypothetical protein ACIOBL_26965 [Paenibacillus taichungensis]|uniref:hypothetical protein n=1 Tax=Paenibacillus taichungensis TaxID=484184 RepID=UPI003811460A